MRLFHHRHRRRWGRRRSGLTSAQQLSLVGVLLLVYVLAVVAQHFLGGEPMAKVWARLEGGPLDGQWREVKDFSWGAVLVRPETSDGKVGVYLLEARIIHGTHRGMVYRWCRNVLTPEAVQDPQLAQQPEDGAERRGG